MDLFLGASPGRDDWNISGRELRGNNLENFPPTIAGEEEEEEEEEEEAAAAAAAAAAEVIIRMFISFMYEVVETMNT